MGRSPDTLVASHQFLFEPEVESLPVGFGSQLRKKSAGSIHLVLLFFDSNPRGDIILTQLFEVELRGKSLCTLEFRVGIA